MMKIGKPIAEHLEILGTFVKIEHGHRVKYRVGRLEGAYLLERADWVNCDSYAVPTLEYRLITRAEAEELTSCEGCELVGGYCGQCDGRAL